ncbi:lysophospholipid acyltransferase family protein [Rhodohalobacter halophilus]|uniref:lysophospholipid acyltransferase family protein n=1 Tax=Rhodohalobacter halophilus TaxID=1812810 RepID=UPI00083F7C65|nr:lysophospholipid acyltransferase family protein [Rhodohalobacter halophilus]
MSDSKQRLTITEYIRSSLAIVLFFLMLLFMTPFILILLFISAGRLSNFVVEKIAPLIVKPVFPVAGIDFSIKKHSGNVHYPAVYIINHSSTLDILTILALGLPRVRFVAKWQLQYNPLFFLLGRLTGQVFIRREKSDKAVQTLKKNVDRIKRRGLTVMLAPEGSRKHPGVIGPFKKGPFRMAMDLGYPIVPIYFEGNRELSKGGFLFTKQGKATAHIHDPIDTEDWTLENLEEKIEEVRSLYLNWADVN